MHVRLIYSIMHLPDIVVNNGLDNWQILFLSWAIGYSRFQGEGHAIKVTNERSK